MADHLEAPPAKGFEAGVDAGGAKIFVVTAVAHLDRKPRASAPKKTPARVTSNEGSTLLVVRKALLATTGITGAPGAEDDVLVLFERATARPAGQGPVERVRFMRPGSSWFEACAAPSATMVSWSMGHSPSCPTRSPAGVSTHGADEACPRTEA